jgi:hypothetical protein
MPPATLAFPVKNPASEPSAMKAAEGCGRQMKVKKNKKKLLVKKYTYEGQHEDHHCSGGFVLGSAVANLALVSFKISLAEVGKGKRF